MIDDLSKSLRAILQQKGQPAELAAAQVLFEHPTDKFTPQQTTIDLFLYDVREDLNLRNNEPKVWHEEGEVVTQSPPLRIACSYLVTAWPVGGPDLALQEHRLLSQVLVALARTPVIPEHLLQGSLKGQKPLPPLVTAVVDPQKNLSEFWTALGSQLRPSITLTATVGLQTAEVLREPLVVSEDIRIREHAGVVGDVLPAWSQGDSLRIGGRIRNSRGETIEGARVTIPGQTAGASSDSRGRYVLEVPHPGRFQLRIRAAGIAKSVDIEVPSANRGAYDVILGGK